MSDKLSHLSTTTDLLSDPPSTFRKEGDSVILSTKSFLDDTKADISSINTELHPTGIVLQRSGYYTIPPLDKLTDFMADDGKCIVPYFTVGRKGYGSVYFGEPIDVAGLNLDDLVHFRHKEVIIYPDDENKPPVGEELNRKAQITLDQVWPYDEKLNEPIKDCKRLEEMNFEEKLRAVCDKSNKSFVEYRPETGSCVFLVEHFSKHSMKFHEKKTKCFKCDYCAKTFKREYHRTKHVNRVHSTKVKKYICPLCGSHVGEIPIMRIHFERFHKNDGKFSIAKGKSGKFHLSRYFGRKKIISRIKEVFVDKSNLNNGRLYRNDDQSEETDQSEEEQGSLRTDRRSTRSSLKRKFREDQSTDLSRSPKRPKQSRTAPQVNDTESSDDDRTILEIQRELNNENSTFEFVGIGASDQQEMENVDDDVGDFGAVVNDGTSISDAPASQSQLTGLFDAPSTTNTLDGFGTSTNTFDQVAPAFGEHETAASFVAAETCVQPHTTPVETSRFGASTASLGGEGSGTPAPATRQSSFGQTANTGSTLFVGLGSSAPNSGFGEFGTTTNTAAGMLLNFNIETIRLVGLQWELLYVFFF